MARVSRKQLEQLAVMVNEAFASRGSVARVVVEQRYDYHALDLTTVDYLENHPGAAVKSLRLGSTGELDTYMRAMLEAFWLLAPPYGPGVEGCGAVGRARARGERVRRRA